MNICPICGKPMGWQGTITLTTSTGTCMTTDGIFWFAADTCRGHAPTTYISTTTAPMHPNCRTTARPVPMREPVPAVFQDAFEEDLCP